jgi:glycosyltransferase involved in cell wall biosynthesis
LRIALVHPFAWPDVRRGGERYFHELTAYLRGQGHLVDTIAGTEAAPHATIVTGGVDRRVHQLPKVVRGNVRLREAETFGVRAYPSLLRHRYDVVHALVPSAAIAAKLAGHRTVFTLLGHPTPELLARRPAQRRLLRATFRLADAVTALSSHVADDIERTLGRAPVIVPPGVDLGAFSPQPRAEPPTILFASALRPEKGVDVLLRAFATVAAIRPDVRLLLCGPGDSRWAFDAAGASVDPVRERIDDIGPGLPDELPARYARAHVTVLPSRNEAFGLVLAESLASGTPIVGCYGGGADDIVTPEVGRLTAHGDADGLAVALLEALELAADEATARRCVARAETWSWDTAVGPAHERVYRTVAKG